MNRDIAITVKYLALVREMTRRNMDIIMIPKGSVVSYLIDYITKSYGRQMRSNLLGDEAKSKSRFSLIINGEILDRSKFDKMILNDKDEVAIIPPIAGGQ
ncbi:MAG: MoaD/ThiS family protein [Thaumarchaeota archaeon]|nr:MoaD/ThiS family protein [Nitrososphaerota archaeon]